MCLANRNRIDTIEQILFEYDVMSDKVIIGFCNELPLKLIRWLAINHPDNRTRKLLLRRTGISIGKDSVINTNFIVSDNYEPLLTIGDRVSIAPNVTVICAVDPNNSMLRENAYVVDRIIEKAPVAIGDDAWIGAGAVILPGVVVGRKAIVGAGAIVTEDVEESKIVAGVPAKVVRDISE